MNTGYADYNVDEPRADLIEVDNYIIPLGKILNIVSSNEYKNILIDVPIGLKNLGFKIVSYLEEKFNDKNFHLNGNFIWGFCDLNLSEIESYDLILHFSHEVPLRIVNTISQLLNIKNIFKINNIFIIELNRSKQIVSIPVYYKLIPELLSKGIETLLQYFNKYNDYLNISYSRISFSFNSIFSLSFFNSFKFVYFLF